MKEFAVEREELGGVAALVGDVGLTLGAMAAAALDTIARQGEPWDASGHDPVSTAFAERYEEPARAARFNALQQDHQLEHFSGLLGTARRLYELAEVRSEDASRQVEADREALP